MIGFYISLIELIRYLSLKIWFLFFLSKHKSKNQIKIYFTSCMTWSWFFLYRTLTSKTHISPGLPVYSPLSIFLMFSTPFERFSNSLKNPSLSTAFSRIWIKDWSVGKSWKASEIEPYSSFKVWKWVVLCFGVLFLFISAKWWR